ncbi:N-acetylneuraminate synthase family protein [Rhodobacteraceae bacterium nBUS_24]
MTTIIAEAGSNHNGCKYRACELVEIAKECSASICKFQFINADGLYLPEYYDELNKVYIPNKVHAARQNEQMSRDDWKFVWEFASSIRMEVTASVFDKASADLLVDLGASSVKIASSDLNNYELHDYVANRFSDIIISTGMATFDEVLTVYNRFESTHSSVEVKFMYCTSLYPSTLENIDLGFLKLMINKFGVDNVGFSDHTSDNYASVMCKSLGISLFEKHFTTSKTLTGFDHAHALERLEFNDYVNTLVSMDKLNEPRRERDDLVTSSRARRGLYASRDMQPGEVLRREDILCVRPSATLTPVSLETLIGKTVSEHIKKFQPYAYEGNNVIVGASSRVDAEAHWTQEMISKGMIS